MDVATLTKTYQKKMWLSMISRKKLNIDPWDLISFTKEKVYYVTYKHKIKKEVNIKECNQCNKLLKLGFSIDIFNVSQCECVKDASYRHPTVKKLSSLFTKKEAEDILNEINLQKTRNLPNKLKYWLDQGFTKEEAAEKTKVVQTKRSAKSPATKKGMTDYTCRRPEFWLKKGYTEEEALEKIKEVQIGNGLEWYLKRYGEEGKILYENRLKKWITSYNLALENDPTIDERKSVKLGRASKMSLGIFLPIYEKYKNIYKIYLGIDDNVEYFLRNKKTLYFYDFTIPELKLIVEYNGSKFHPNKELLTEEEWKNWRCLFSNTPAELKYKMDEVKHQIAINDGYTVMVVWDNDNIQHSIKQIETYIENRNRE